MKPEQQPLPEQRFLPRVSPAAIVLVISEMVVEEQSLGPTAKLMVTENPDLFGMIDQAADFLSDGDPETAERLSWIAALTYRALRSQAEADQLDATYDVP